MGRLLEIARNEDLPAPPTRHEVPGPAAIHLPLLVPMLASVPAEPPFDEGASAVLDILVTADRPAPHPEIVRHLATRGHDKTAARQAIARCQKRRWIEHNMETGYVFA